MVAIVTNGLSPAAAVQYNEKKVAGGRANALLAMNFGAGMSERPEPHMVSDLAINYMYRIGFGNQPYLVYDCTNNPAGGLNFQGALRRKTQSPDLTTGAFSRASNLTILYITTHAPQIILISKLISIPNQCRYRVANGILMSG